MHAVITALCVPPPLSSSPLVSSSRAPYRVPCAVQEQKRQVIVIPSTLTAKLSSCTSTNTGNSSPSRSTFRRSAAREQRNGLLTSTVASLEYLCRLSSHRSHFYSSPIMFASVSLSLARYGSAQSPRVTALHPFFATLALLPLASLLLYFSHRFRSRAFLIASTTLCSLTVSVLF